MSFAKFLKAAFLTEHLRWLLLNLVLKEMEIEILLLQMHVSKFHFSSFTVIENKIQEMLYIYTIAIRQITRACIRGLK